MGEGETKIASEPAGASGDRDNRTRFVSIPCALQETNCFFKITGMGWVVNRDGLLEQGNRI
jgi:hypothetical protein